MLTKTLLKLAMECPVKVHYARDGRYVNTRKDDEFLEALTEGGHQVGALAKLMFRAADPDAVEVVSRDREEQLAQTRELLARDSVTVFEGTARVENLLIRSDILVKRGEVVDLIEVKAKAWNPRKDSLTGLTSRQAPIRLDMAPYVLDLAFQYHVLSQAYPELTFRPYFLFVDKSWVNSVSGLGSRIRWVGGDAPNVVEVDPDFDVSELDPPPFVQVDATEAVDTAIWLHVPRRGRSEVELLPLIEATTAVMAAGDRPRPQLSTACKTCEFYCPPTERTEAHRSGWAECMETVLGRPADRPRSESVFGFYHHAPLLNHLIRGRLWMHDLEEHHVEPKMKRGAFSRSDRQHLQWLETKYGVADIAMFYPIVREAMSEWQFPLHFIDFETVASPLPFHQSVRPYQSVLFQFSHHLMEADGRIRHAHECLEYDSEESPSIRVLRCLREAIGQDQGTVLHWYPHERTVLKGVRDEIRAAAPPDADELLAFLDELGLGKDEHRRLRDLGQLVARCVFLPGTGGSSSMKRVLPAIIRLSSAVRTKYAQPVYGTTEIPSLNFSRHTWVVEANGETLDPYRLLAPVFADRGLVEAIEQLDHSAGEYIANGAAAMVAYGRLQDPGMPGTEKAELAGQLKRYCELDTLAMVMVYEALVDWIRSWERAIQDEPGAGVNV